MLFSRNVGVLLIIAMLLPEKASLCDAPGNANCSSIFGTLLIRDEDGARNWTALRRLHGRLIVATRKGTVSLPQLKEIVGKPPLMVIQGSRVHLPRLERLTPLVNSSKPRVKIEGEEIRTDGATLIQLHGISEGKMEIDGLSWEGFLEKEDPRGTSRHFTVVLIVLCLFSCLLLPFALVRGLFTVESKVLDWKVMADVGEMRPFLLERRREKFSRLDAYFDRRNAPLYSDDLHKILGICNPDKAQKLIYRHEPMGMKRWAKEQQKKLREGGAYARLSGVLPPRIPRYLHKRDKDEQVADLRRKKLTADKMKLGLVRRRKLKDRLPNLQTNYDRARLAPMEGGRDSLLWRYLDDDDEKADELGRWK